jgi:hypothetical protein
MKAGPLIRCDFCKASGRAPIRHSDSCPHSDYMRGCRLCSALDGTPHKPGCLYLSSDQAAIDKAVAEARANERKRGLL